MTALTDRKMVRTGLFFAFNVSVVLFVTAFVIAPVLAHFADRSDDINEDAAQLAHFRSITRNAKAMVAIDPQAAEPFLPGREERVVSADLQANLMSAAATAGVRLLGVRGLQSQKSRNLHMVAVSAELEGSVPAIRGMIVALESQVPFLFVFEASFHSIADGDGGQIRAELKVQGAMRERESSSEKAIAE